MLQVIKAPFTQLRSIRIRENEDVTMQIPLLFPLMSGKRTRDYGSQNVPNNDAEIIPKLYIIHKSKHGGL